MTYKIICYRICETVSLYYKYRFMYQWMFEKKSHPISGLAALLVERGSKMEVVVLTTRTTKKRKCSYFLNNGSANECVWGYCDGHAVTVCYRFAVFYLIREMHRHESIKNEENKKRVMASILEIQPGGYALKKGVKLHLFSTKLPCGFMAEEECPLLSWKIPFKTKPHCLKCSSTIMISAYLGIQGPLSHLFSKPVYISSITIPKHDNITALKAAKIKRHFESLDKLLKSNKNTTDIGYNLNIPSVEIADVDTVKLFPYCFKPCDDKSCLEIQIRERLTEDTIRQIAGVIVEIDDDNIGSTPKGIIYSLDNVLGTDELHKKIVSQLKYGTKDLTNEIKVLKLKSLKEAQNRLSIALKCNTGIALEKLRISLITKMNDAFTSNHQSSGIETEQCKSTADEVTVQVNKLKNSFCTITKRIQAVKESVPLLKQNFKTDSKLLIDSLESLNKSMEEFETSTDSLVNALTNYRDYQETLDALNNLLQKSNGSSCDPQFYLDLMGCDWARFLKIMDNDIKMGK